MTRLLVLLTALLAASPALAVTRTVDDSGGQDFTSIDACADASSAGDICEYWPGTYGAISLGTGGTAGNPITIRPRPGQAEAAVLCADPTNDPDGCEVQTDNLGTVTGDITLTADDASYWVIEGLKQTSGKVSCQGTSDTVGPDNLTIRYFHSTSDHEDQAFLIHYCDDVTIEHSLFFDSVDGTTGPDYAIQCIEGSDGLTVRNVWTGGGFGHNIAVKRDCDGVTIERLVCEGGNQCLHIGQNMDDQDTISGGTQCTGVTLDDGTTGDIYDHTSSNVTIDQAFSRDLTVGATTYTTLYGLRFNNVSDMTVTDLFVGNSDDFAIMKHHGSVSGTKVGQCGVEPGNVTILGFVLVDPEPNECINLRGTGHDPDTIRFYNGVCHNPGSFNEGMEFDQSLLSNASAWETLDHPTTVAHNLVFNDCRITFRDPTEARVTDSHIDEWNCSIPREGTNYLNVDPSFKGPETVATPTRTFADGEKLWDWAGEYKPIIDQWDTTNASLEDAGTDVGELFVGTAPDVGANEWFQIAWGSCARIKPSGAELTEFPASGIDDPYTAGEGLIVDVDCIANKLVVAGACSDPLDQTTCDATVYVHKTAYIGDQRDLDEITLESGAEGAPTDTTGNCWRTRATYDWLSRSLDVTSRVYVRFEVDTDGGTHTCDSIVGWAGQLFGRDRL